MKRMYLLSLIIVSLGFLVAIPAAAHTLAATPGRGQQEVRGLLSDSTDGQIAQFNNPVSMTTWAITRTEDSDPAVVYAGSWATQTNPQFSDLASNIDYTYSDTPGDTATYSFSGTWVHIGFITSQESGQAEILIDGVSRGVVDLYSPGFSSSADVASFAYSGLQDVAHTLTISVTGSSHPFANGQMVKLDFIDTWDGTLMPDGTFEEDHSRIWYSDDWVFQSDPVASGGGYADKELQGNTTAWFPFTGDSFTYQALSDSSAGEVRFFVDGQPLPTLDLYSSETVTRTFSFNGFGPGPHVLTLRHFLADITLDALTTPGSTPYYQEPVYDGIVRYEEYHPSLNYGGADYFHRPRTWTASFTGGTSGQADLVSSTANDAVSLTFDGTWVNLGFRAGSNRGQAEVFVDGVSQGIIGLYAPSETLTSFQFGGFPAGTHTLTLTVLGQPDPPSSGSAIYLDYIDVWDGTPMPDGYVNAQRSQPSGRLHYSAGGVDVVNTNAYQGDYLATTLPNNNVNVWYAFTGDSFTYLAFSSPTGATSEVYLDDVLLDTVDTIYPFSQQPMAYHYTGFTDGPHLVRVHNVLNMRVDAFASNPTFLGPYQPLAEWWETDRTGGASIWGGVHVPIAAGDVTGDGDIELMVASSNVDNSGELFLLRGDGGDAGGGTPILWSVPYNIANGFEDVAAPAIAELDGQPGAEIIHPTIDGLFVYHSDGTTYWMTDTLKSHVFFGTPAVGNLDQDPEPEIVVNLDDTLAVFEPDGDLAWQTTLMDRPGMPLLADLTGDGNLDILFHESGDTLYLYDYNLGSPTLAWTRTFTTPLHIYGGPAVADIDGRQPGGDPGPEIAIASEGWAHVLDADGSMLWSTPLDSGRSGGVAIADLDGDGEVEIVTTMEAGGGRIYALNADGTLLWSAPALDNSPLSVSLADLDGDGDYEVAWNGSGQGLTLFNGADGAVLFNEPHLSVISQTGSDYPLFADVDLDGYGEIVVASQTGVRVFGFDGYWGPGRSLWNQHTYHITNIDDDLTVPASEPDSWAAHNTYRAQFTPGGALRGVDLTPQTAGLAAEPGETVVYTLVLTNTGNRTDTFSLGYAGNTWSVQLPVLQTTLAAGQSQQITVEVTIPPGTPGGQMDTVTITATSQADPGVFDSADLTTTSLASAFGYPLYLPLVAR